MQDEGKFRQYDRAPVEYVKAAKYGGKKLRAEPVAMRYEVGRVHHVGVLPGLKIKCVRGTPRPESQIPGPGRRHGHACLWLRDQEGRRSMVSSAANNLILPVTRLTPLG